MIPEESKNEIQNVCDFKYLVEMMSDEKDLIIEIMNTFLLQTPKDLNNINHAVDETNYATISSLTHNIKSSAFVMGILILVPILQEMEDLGRAAVDIRRIKELNQALNSICTQAIEEIEKEKLKYVEYSVCI